MEFVLALSEGRAVGAYKVQLGPRPPPGGGHQQRASDLESQGKGAS